MIRVEINYIDDKFKSLLVNGHADSGEYGEDLVCAAVSAVVTGGFNSIEDSDNFVMELNSGNAKLIAKEEVSYHDQIVIESLIVSLETIRDSYPKNLTIKKGGK